MPEHIMRIWTLACLTLLLWVKLAQADWAVQDIGSEHVARACSTGNETVCFELACTKGELIWRLSSQDVIDMIAAPKARMMVLVSGRLAGEILFEQTGPGQFSAPMRPAHTMALSRLKAARLAELRLWFDLSIPPKVITLDLTGSRRALNTVEASCTRSPAPDMESASDMEDASKGKQSDNPLADLLDGMKAACDLLGGAVLPMEGLAEAVDLDGKAPIDLRLNHARATCSALPSTRCGPAGCVTSLWLGQEGGGYMRVFAGNLHDLSLPEPGMVEMVLHGAACAQSNTAPCIKQFTLRNGVLLPSPENPA